MTGLDWLKTLPDETLARLEVKRYQLVPDAVDDLANGFGWLCPDYLHDNYGIGTERDCAIGCDCTKCTRDWLTTEMTVLEDPKGEESRKPYHSVRATVTICIEYERYGDLDSLIEYAKVDAERRVMQGGLHATDVKVEVIE